MFNYDPVLMKALQDDRMRRLRTRHAHPRSGPPPRPAKQQRRRP
ncbi:MAG: hypothetical protein QNJ12_03335 [Ilumatobacter sp.]|nr:hypothetical protein [Ilumatobacter sp.]MDJ0767794.1 hypothetical protein [Ilumatobacter sp.]